MRKINKTLVAGALAFSTFNVNAEVSPFNFGVKVGGSLAKLNVNDEAKLGKATVQGSLVKNFFVTGGVYGGYAFSDYLGVELGCNYLKQGGVLTASEGSSENDNSGTPKKVESVSMMIHGIEVPLSLCVYPIGREEGEGFVKLSLGGAFFVPVNHTLLAGESNIEIKEDKEKELSGFDFGLKLGAAYEFPFGLNLGMDYGLGFLNKIKLDEGQSSKLFESISDFKSAKDHHFTFNVGYNFGALLA